MDAGGNSLAEGQRLGRAQPVVIIDTQYELQITGFSNPGDPISGDLERLSWLEDIRFSLPLERHKSNDLPSLLNKGLDLF